MRNVIVSNVVTLDGFFEGPNRELDWHLMENLKDRKGMFFAEAIHLNQ